MVMGSFRRTNPFRQFEHSSIEASGWTIKASWHGARQDLCGPDKDAINKAEADKVETTVDEMVSTANAKDAASRRALVNNVYRNSDVLPNLRTLAQVLAYIV